MRRTSFIALLRGINVGGANRVPMAELRELCAELGWSDVRTYIASGNVVFGASGPEGELATALEEAIRRRFDLHVPVIVRTASHWERYVRGNPFGETPEAEAKHVMLGVSKAPPAASALETLRARATGGERVERVGDALWIHYAAGVARSKLSPGMLDRAVGSPVTTRNWRTVVKLGEMVGG